MCQQLFQTHVWFLWNSERLRHLPKVAQLISDDSRLNIYVLSILLRCMGSGRRGAWGGDDVGFFVVFGSIIK